MTVINFIFRFLKWIYLTKISKFKITHKDNFLMYLSANGLSITPGKAGDLMKTVFMKNIKNIEYRKSMPLVLVDRISDGLAVLIFMILTVNYFANLGNIIYVFLGMVIIGILIIQQKNFCLWVLDKLTFKKIQTAMNFIKDFYLQTRQITKVKPLLVITSLSAIAWLAEGIGFYYILVGLGISLDQLSSIFIYLFSSLFGTLTFVPGGIGVTEAGILGLLLFKGVPEGAAAAATILIRIATIWFSVVAGMLGWLFLLKKYKEKVHLKK